MVPARWDVGQTEQIAIDEGEMGVAHRRGETGRSAGQEGGIGRGGGLEGGPAVLHDVGLDVRRAVLEVASTLVRRHLFDRSDTERRVPRAGREDRTDQDPQHAPLPVQRRLRIGRGLHPGDQSRLLPFELGLGRAHRLLGIGHRCCGILRPVAQLGLRHLGIDQLRLGPTLADLG